MKRREPVLSASFWLRYKRFRESRALIKVQCIDAYEKGFNRMALNLGEPDGIIRIRMILIERQLMGLRCGAPHRLRSHRYTCRKKVSKMTISINDAFHQVIL